jgi:arginyl-tRNA synthetase
MIRDLITNLLADLTGVKDPNLEFPDNKDFGDFSTNVAIVSKISADELVEKLRKNAKLLEIIERIEVAGPGFINFWLKDDVLVGNLIHIGKQEVEYGKSDLMTGQKIMFEYAHPNTHKAFHIGHLRNITTGETLSRLYEWAGAKVLRVNYQGDIGLHIAKAIWGIKKIGFSDPKDVKSRAEFLGKAYAVGASAYEEDETAKVEIGKLNAAIYDNSDSELTSLYRETRKWSLDYFDSIYKRVYTKFDRLYFESEVAESGKKIALKALKDGILEKSEGAIIFPGSKYGLHDRVFISSKGVPTYEAKDLGLAKLQFGEYDPDKLIHTVGPEQTGYFKVVFKALELILPETQGREFHIPYGWVRLREGKMSSRTGNVILGEDIVDKAKEDIKKEFKTDDKTAEIIAVGAVKYSFLKTGLNQDIAFDLKESISLEGNSGPYVQYTIARINSVLAKAGKNTTIKEGPLSSEEYEILRFLFRFQDIIASAAKSYSPNLLCNYLYDLAQKFNTFYNAERIIGSDNEAFRLKLASGTAQILKNGLQLLGIEAPERM